MRKTLCKRLFIFLMAFCVFNFSASSQDSSKTVTRSPEKPVTQAPVKKTTKPISKPAVTLAQPANEAVNTPAPAQPVDNSLNGQYEVLLKHSWIQQGYKVVNPNRLTSLWKSVNDTINEYKKQLSASKQQSVNLEKQLTELKAQSTNKEEKISESPKVSVNEIRVLGIYLNADTYNWIVWGIILVLAIALTTILLTTAKRGNDSKHHKQLYDEISSEYQSFKTKAKEKELKLARELQTERNTIEELLAKRNEGGPDKKS